MSAVAKVVKKKGLFLLLAVALMVLACAQALMQAAFERRYPTTSIESLLYLPKGEQLKVFSLGYRTVLADALWMKAIGYFGGHNLTDQEYPWLYHILDQVTTLDPLFLHPYLFGGNVLANEEGDPGKSTLLLRKGMDYYPGDWRLPFYIGFNHFYYQRDPEKAADYIWAAASLPSRPEYLPRLAASLLSKAGRLQTAITLLETVLENTQEEYVRRGLLEKIKNLREGKIPESLENFLKEPEASP